MHFLLLCSLNETRWKRVPAPERSGIMAEYGEVLRDLSERGFLKSGAKLKPVATAKTLMGKRGGTVVVDGPYTEAKEHLGGFHLIECRDMDEAIAIARRIPSLRAGSAI